MKLQTSNSNIAATLQKHCKNIVMILYRVNFDCDAFTHAYVVTEHAQLITKHTHVASFRRYDRFPNLNSRQL